MLLLVLLLVASPCLFLVGWHQCCSCFLGLDDDVDAAVVGVVLVLGVGGVSDVDSVVIGVDGDVDLALILLVLFLLLPVLSLLLLLTVLRLLVDYSAVSVLGVAALLLVLFPFLV